MDDLVLNLAEAGPSTRAVPNKKGGRWTERVKAKQTAKRKAQSTTSDKPGADASTAGDSSRQAKRRKTDSTSAPKPKAVAAAATTPTASRPSMQIISSLFSRNPTVDAPAPTSNRTRSLALPSNAPINSSSFSGLGLDPLLVAHLSAKFSIDKPTSIQRAALPALLRSSNGGAARDAFLQSQTGSGKTLSFLLPIIQDLLPLSSLSWIDRSVGTLAIIIAPTRELAKQISDVLEVLLKLRLRGADEAAEDAAERRTRWLVSGLLTGGATRTHEKARLRKGVPILVATPGRLLDHLQNTASFDAGKCRWLVLDEADRLMELGFEDTLAGILKGLDGRRRLAVQAVEEGVSTDVGGWDWSVRRRTVLCSATIREDVQKLAGMALTNSAVIKATENDEAPPPPGKDADALEKAVATNNNFTPPSQLSQRYVVVPLKLRLVTLVSLLRSILSQVHAKRGSKVIVFFSCTDSVDFHFRLLAEASMSDAAAAADAGADADRSDDEGAASPAADAISAQSVLLPGASVFRLHGSLALVQRQAAVRAFGAPGAPGVLLCTSVASRGLDLPLVRAVVQYDLPTEGGATEYVHRVGRTARAGRGGEAWALVAPSEAGWAPWAEARMRGEGADKDPGGIRLQQQGLDAVLKEGFGGKGTEYEERATEVQLAFERWALSSKEHMELARKAYLSHIRAYATHPSEEKHLFHVKHLHLGHLAKAFALREAPSAVTKKTSGTKTEKVRLERAAGKVKGQATNTGTVGKAREREWQETYDPETEARMNRAVREQGKLTKRKGRLVSTGTGEFQIASGDALEALVKAR